MRRAFPWFFLNYLVGFLLFLAAQSLILGLGMRFVLDTYSNFQSKELNATAKAILVDPQSVELGSLELNSSFFVFSADKKLVFSNRGRGKGIPDSDYIPVEYQDATIGYFYAGEMQFQDNEANQIFFSSLLILVVTSLFISLVVGLAFAVYSSRRVALPVSQLTDDIRKIGKIEEVESRSFSITELTEISSALTSLSKILASDEEYKRQWMQDIAHDLRTPISGLKGQLEGMRDGVLEPSAPRFEKNLIEIERLHRLVEAISDLYQIENVRQLIHSTFPTREFIDELLAPHEVTILEKNLTINTRVDGKTITGQRDLLLRGIGNIVDNALAYAEAGCKITISAKESHGLSVFRISDDGPGISVGQLDKIFHRFYRGDFARKSPGTGLGLNIAREIIRRHNGTIGVEAVKPRGVTFIVSLPKTGKSS